MSETHEVLGHDLVKASVLRGSFQLRSGAQSSYYIDKYLFTTQPDLLRRIAAELAARLPGDVQRLAGPVLGAVPLVTALSLQTCSSLTGQPRRSANSRHLRIWSSMDDSRCKSEEYRA